ncbi:hypothetical protein ABT061_04090 [Streptosporangium sp. NPDC002544]|uniref:hypothetical protein n=1 Tax=Streptosporangium sp. NPDC002544 TaxID=3154538 RepID=UPI0033275332
MSRRTLVWLGVTVALAALIALGWYFIAVGLDRADKLASVLGAFVGLVGLGLAVFGVVSARPEDAEPGPESGGVHNEISGTVHGNAVQARDIEGGITFDAPKPYRPQEMD